MNFILFLNFVMHVFKHLKEIFVVRFCPPRKFSVDAHVGKKGRVHLSCRKVCQDCNACKRWNRVVFSKFLIEIND